MTGDGDFGPLGLLWTQRIHEPRRELLALIDSNTGLASTVIPFKIPTPDARVQVRAGITISPNVPGPAIPYDVTFGGLILTGLWLAAGIYDEAGQLIPVTNLVGTRSSPLSIPTDTDLMGYSETLLTDADEIMGELTVESSTGEIGTLRQRWELVTRYQPVSGALFSEREWQQIVARCQPRVTTAVISLEGV